MVGISFLRVTKLKSKILPKALNLSVATIVALSGIFSAVPFLFPASAAAATLSVCTSGCTYTSIQTAVTAAAAGDTISVGPGTYAEVVSISSKNLTLLGSGSSQSTVTAFNIANANVTIDGFTINPGSSNSGVGLQFNSGTSETIQNNVITGYGYDSTNHHGTEGVSLAGTSGLVFQHNVLTSPTPTGQTQFSAAAAQDGIFFGSGVSNNIQILNNTFTNASTYPGTDIGLSVTSASNPVISGNTSTGGATFVTLFNSTGSYVTNNNATTDPNISGSGIYIGGGDTNTTVTGNTATGFFYGVALRNNFGDGPSTGITITSNTLTNNYGGGIGAAGTAINASETVIAHNNDLSGSNPVGVSNTTSGIINATSNYWGSPNPNFTLVISGSGSVTHTPWYTDNMTTLSTADDLTSLSLSAGTLSPAFSSTTTSYSALVANSVTTVSTTSSASTGASVTFSAGGSNLAIGSNTVTVTSADGTGNKAYTVTVNQAAATQTLPDNSGNATINNATPQVVVTSSTQPVNITVTSGTTDATIDYSSLKTSSTTAVVPQTTIQTQSANVQIQAGTTVTASGSWDGVINLPTVQTNSNISIPTPPGTSTTLGTVIDVGSDSVNLTFDKPVRLLIAGQANKLVGFIRNGTFTQITTACTADNANTQLSANNDCFINVDSDMVIWTKHFTKFATYTQDNTYVVQSGDTMSGIAAKFGLTLAQLEALNPQAGHPAGNFSLILPGDVLSVGGAVVTASTSAAAQNSTPEQSTTPKILGESSSPLSSTPKVSSAGIVTAKVANNHTWYWWATTTAFVLVVLGGGSYYYILRKKA